MKKLPLDGLFSAKFLNLISYSQKAAPSEIQEFISKRDRPAFNIFYWMESYLLRRYIAKKLTSKTKNMNEEIIKDDMTEMFPVVDETGQILSAATRQECHGGSKLLHPVVHLHVFDPAGRLYLQQRPEWKDIQAGKWDTAIGGHVALGEHVEQALRREAKEELGLEGFEPEFLDSYVFESDRERELVNTYRTTVDVSAPKPSAELSGGRFWTSGEISENIGKGIFTPNFESEYRRLFMA